jgi:SP family general alpha glucoside:H+ symporter-like MFS transporter
MFSGNLYVTYVCVKERANAEVPGRFERKVNLRKFDTYVTEVQMRAEEVHGGEQMRM